PGIRGRLFGGGSTGGLEQPLSIQRQASTVIRDSLGLGRGPLIEQFARRVTGLALDDRGAHMRQAQLGRALAAENADQYLHLHRPGRNVALRMGMWGPVMLALGIADVIFFDQPAAVVEEAVAQVG